MKKIYLILGLAALAILGLMYAASQNAAAPRAAAQMQVSASFYPLAFFAKTIGGDRVEVYDVTPAGAEPHDYEPTPQDLARIERGRALILNGAGLEGWGTRVRDTLQGSGVDVIEVTDGIAAAGDPHIWLSPALAKQIVNRLTGEFVKLNPANQSYYQENASALNAKLNALDAAYRATLSRCARKDLVTSHAAFGYLASDYGLVQVAIAGISPDAEPTPQDLAQLAALVRARGVRAIFYESLASPKLAEALAAETGAETLALDPLEGLTDAQIASGKDYFTQMDMNLANLSQGLSCGT